MALLLKTAFRCSNLNKQLITNKNYFQINKLNNNSSLVNFQIKQKTTKFIILNQFLNKTVRFSSSPVNFQQENSQSKALILISDLKELRSSPRPALTVALLGLLPLALPPFYFIYSQIFASQFAFGQLAYGTIVLSFLGGIQWGHTLTSNHKILTSPDNSVSNNLNNWKNTCWSVVPCLVGWFSLLMPLSVGFLSATMGHGLVLYRDMTSVGTYPSWFRALRFIFSLVAIMALWTSCICFYAFDEKKRFEIINK